MQKRRWGLRDGSANIATLLLLTLIVSCSTPGAIMKRNTANLMTLEMGMSKQAVLDVMGSPNHYEAYESLQGSHVEILFYYTNKKWADGVESKDECTPVVISDGRLIGMGDEFYKSTIHHEIKVKHD